MNFDVPLKNPYSRSDGRRFLPEDFRAYIAARTGSAAVGGFSQMQDAGDAKAGGPRIAGFMENSDFRKWFLPLSAGRGMSWRTAPVPASNLDKISFVLAIGFGNGSPLPQPSGSWDLYVNDRLAISCRVVKHSKLWRNAECSLAFAANRIESAPPNGSISLSSDLPAEGFAAFGPALLTVPASWMQIGAPALIRMEAANRVESTRWFSLAATKDMMFSANLFPLIELAATVSPPKIGGYSVYFGDIHNHSGEMDGEEERKGCGIDSREENYRYARHAGGLDFYALTEHEFQIAPARAREYFELADRHNDDGTFVCLPGYEFTSLLYGHRNIYFRGPGGILVDSTKGGGWPTLDPAHGLHPAELWQALEHTGLPFLSIPHHTSSASHPFNLSLCHPQHDRLIEVYSCWGSSEYCGDFPRGISDRYSMLDVRDALSRGLRLGLMASSDGHDGHPGGAQSPLVKHHHVFHHLGSGLTAALCSNLAREEIFDALYARRCYATTGVPIILSFDIDGHVMGSSLPALKSSARPALHIACQGTNGLDHVRIIKNGRIVHSLPCHGERSCDLTLEDPCYTPSPASYYYVRVVQVDGESAWSSPIWIE